MITVDNTSVQQIHCHFDKICRCTEQMSFCRCLGVSFFFLNNTFICQNKTTEELYWMRFLNVSIPCSPVLQYSRMNTDVCVSQATENSHRFTNHEDEHFSLSLLLSKCFKSIHHCLWDTQIMEHRMQWQYGVRYVLI